MKPILEVRNISKKYKIGKRQKGYLSLRDQLVDSMKSIFSKNNNLSFSQSGNESTNTEFYALKDISFDVYPGDTIGIIGRNGAGKSTLLKILSKITPPTSGYIKARGRVASLLEVGTGFHPELTGRENIYLNGAILGMRRWEINEKFDEIIDFSGVEQFLDTPLKHYSSGMQLRLAFAVAAHLEPEILLIDEVLAVGDAEFQKKCLGKMDEVSKSGRTILFVSHDLVSIEQLCSKAIMIKNKKAYYYDNSFSCIKAYINSQEFLREDVIVDKKIISLNKLITSYDEDKRVLSLEFYFNPSLEWKEVYIDLGIINERGIFTLHLRHQYEKNTPFIFDKKEKKIKYHINHPNLIPGKYTIVLYVYERNGQVLLWLEHLGMIEIYSTQSGVSFSGIKSSTLPQFNIIEN